MLVDVDGSGNLWPFLTHSLFKIGGPSLYEIQTSHWNGSEWKIKVIRDDLLRNPQAVTAWREQVAPAHDEIVYIYDDFGTLTLQTMDAVTGAISATEVLRPTLGQRASVAIRNADNEPAFAWFTQLGILPLTTYYARWDGGAVQDVTALTPCTGDWPTLALDGDDDYHIVCRQLIVNNDHYDVVYVYQINGVEQMPEVVFGAADNHQWQYPAMVMFNGQPAVVAYDLDDRTVVLRRRVATGWLPPVVLQDDVSVHHLALDVLDQGDGEAEFAIAILNNDEIWYTEYHVALGSGTQTSLRRVDLNPDQPGSCEDLTDAVDVALANNGQALTGWLGETEQPLADHTTVKTSRFTQFRRADVDEWSIPQHVSPAETSLASRSTGDHFTCYFQESVINPPQIDLVLRFRDTVDVVMATDTGLPVEPRGCDVATNTLGQPGVLWADSTTGQLRYRAWQGLGMGPIEDLFDGMVPIPATGHLALAYDANDEAQIAFLRNTGQDHPWHGIREAGVWYFEAIDYLEGGAWPDVTFIDGDTDPLVSYTLVDNGGMVTHARSSGGGGWTYTDLVIGKTCWDTSISTRNIQGVDITTVGWINFDDGQLEYADINTGLVYVIDDSPGDIRHAAIEVDAFGDVTASYVLVSPGSPTVFRPRHLRLATKGPFKGGRPNFTAPPVPGRVLCDIRPLQSLGGTDLELDDFDNPRIAHRDRVLDGGWVDILTFLTRP